LGHNIQIEDNYNADKKAAKEFAAGFGSNVIHEEANPSKTSSPAIPNLKNDDKFRSNRHGFGLKSELAQGSSKVL